MKKIKVTFEDGKIAIIEPDKEDAYAALMKFRKMGYDFITEEIEEPNLVTKE